MALKFIIDAALDVAVRRQLYGLKYSFHRQWFEINQAILLALHTVSTVVFIVDEAPTISTNNNLNKILLQCIY